MIQIMLKWAGPIPLILLVGFVCSISTAPMLGEDTNSYSPAELIRVGWSELASNAYADAEASFRAAAFAAPTNAEAYAGMGQSQYNRKDYSWAIRSFEEALERQPSHTDWLLPLGQSYCQFGDSSNATIRLQRYVLLRTNDAEGYKWLSYALSGTARYEEAANAARHSLTLSPSNSYCCRQLGYCLDQLNHHDEAIQAYRRAVAINPLDADAWWSCSQSLLDENRLGEAVPCLEKAYELNKNNQLAHGLLFVCYLGTLQYQKAYELFPAIFAMCGCAATLVFVTGLAFLLPLSFRIRPQLSPGILFSSVWLAIYFEGQLALFLVVAVFCRIKPVDSLLGVVSLAGIPVLLAWTLGFRRQPWGQPFAWPLRLGTKKTIGFGLLGLVLVELFNWAYLSFLALITHKPVPIQETMPLIESALKSSPVLVFLAVAFVAPAVEEILFRGLLYGSLEKRLSTGGTIFVTSLIFAIYHLQPVFLIPLFCIGVVLGWARAQTRSVGLPILIHMLNNAWSLLLLKLAEHNS